jgi:hypothetical protein
LRRKEAVTVAYTPELSGQSSCILRRIAWAIDLPMTKTIEMVFEEFPKYMKREKVCEKCRDKSICTGCIFRP